MMQHQYCCLDAIQLLRDLGVSGNRGRLACRTLAVQRFSIALTRMSLTPGVTGAYV